MGQAPDEKTSTADTIDPQYGSTSGTKPTIPIEQGDSPNDLPAEASPLQVAEYYEAKGLMTQAEAAYAKAVIDFDVPSLEKYARFLRRTGRLRKSLEINRRIIDQLASAHDPTETVSERAQVTSGPHRLALTTAVGSSSMGHTVVGEKP